MSQHHPTPHDAAGSRLPHATPSGFGAASTPQQGPGHVSGRQAPDGPAPTGLGQGQHAPGQQVPGQQVPGQASARGGSATRQGGDGTARRSQRRILGIQPVLFVGICLLAVVTLLTVVLIFVGDFESQAARVVWTVVVFLAFTGLLALDLVLARRSATPLIIGVAANIYLLAVLMLTIWVKDSGLGAGGLDDSSFDDPYVGDWLFGALLGAVFLTILVVRAAAAMAWGLIILGRRAGATFARVIGLIAAALIGLVGVLLTLHFAIAAFGVEVGEWYWRATVAAVVMSALASSITVLLFWNRRNIDWEEAEARGEHRPAAPVGSAAVANPLSAAVAPQPGMVAPATVATAAPAAGVQPLLPWPTFADGTPLPMRSDGQPDFSVFR